MAKKPVFLISFLCFLFIFGFASAEELTITTYYPSPYGSYNELRSSGNTYLAVDSGNVGIGTLAPTEKLQVQGNAIINGTLTAPRVNTPGLIRKIMGSAVTNNISTNSTAYTDIPGMSVNITTEDGFLFVVWNAGICVNGEANRVHVRIMVDDVMVGAYVGGGYGWGGAGDSNTEVDGMGGNTFVMVNAGPHNVHLEWKVRTDITAGTAYITPNDIGGYGGSMTVMEISR